MKSEEAPAKFRVYDDFEISVLGGSTNIFSQSYQMKVWLERYTTILNRVDGAST